MKGMLKIIDEYCVEENSIGIFRFNLKPQKQVLLGRYAVDESRIFALQGIPMPTIHTIIFFEFYMCKHQTIPIITVHRRREDILVKHCGSYWATTPLNSVCFDVL